MQPVPIERIYIFGEQAKPLGWRIGLVVRCATVADEDEPEAVGRVAEEAAGAHYS
jgi:hypothetical protein